MVLTTFRYNISYSLNHLDETKYGCVVEEDMINQISSTLLIFTFIS